MSDVGFVSDAVGFGVVETSFDLLVGALDTVPESASIRIHRQPGSGRDEMPLLDIVDVADYGEDADKLIKMIKRKYGGGRFRLFFREKGIAGNLKNVPLLLEGEPKFEEVEKAAMERVAEPVEAVVARVMSQVLAPVLEKLAAKSEVSVMDEDRFLDRIAKYRSLFSGESKKSDGLAGVTAAVEFLKVMGMEVVPAGGADVSGSELERVVAKVSPLVEKFLQSKSGQGPVSNEGEMKNPMELAIEMMLGAARRGESFDPYVHLIVAQVDESELRQVLGLGIDSALSMFVASEPRIANYREWFVGLMGAMSEKLGVAGV